jgi:hypothetical protein
MTDQDRHRLANVRIMWAAAQHSDPARWVEFCDHILRGLRSAVPGVRDDAKRWQDAIDRRRDEDN